MNCLLLSSNGSHGVSTTFNLFQLALLLFAGATFAVHPSDDRLAVNNATLRAHSENLPALVDDILDFLDNMRLGHHPRRHTHDLQLHLPDEDLPYADRWERLKLRLLNGDDLPQTVVDAGHPAEGAISSSLSGPPGRSVTTSSSDPFKDPVLPPDASLESFMETSRFPLQPEGISYTRPPEEGSARHLHVQIHQHSEEYIEYPTTRMVSFPARLSR